MRREDDPKVLEVLGRALESHGRATRLRAVAMLTRLDCDERRLWLERACGDRDASVRQTAEAVCSWVEVVEDPPWPQREDLPHDLSHADRMEPPPSPTAQDDATPAWRWQYTAEVWASDGLVVGVFGSSSFGEDDEHAKRIALGQAILANAGPRADAFDPAGAAAFIVSKERILGAVRPPNGSC